GKLFHSWSPRVSSRRGRRVAARHRRSLVREWNRGDRSEKCIRTSGLDEQYTAPRNGSVTKAVARYGNCPTTVRWCSSSPGEPGAIRERAHLPHNVSPREAAHRE